MKLPTVFLPDPQTSSLSNQAVTFGLQAFSAIPSPTRTGIGWIQKQSNAHFPSFITMASPSEFSTILDILKGGKESFWNRHQHLTEEERLRRWSKSASELRSFLDALPPTKENLMSSAPGQPPTPLIVATDSHPTISFGNENSVWNTRLMALAQYADLGLADPSRPW